MNIIVIGTNISTYQLKCRMNPILDEHPAIYRWSVDIDDSDHVMRLEANNEMTETQVIKMLNSVGCQGMLMLE